MSFDVTVRVPTIVWNVSHSSFRASSRSTRLVKQNSARYKPHTEHGSRHLHTHAQPKRCRERNNFCEYTESHALTKLFLHCSSVPGFMKGQRKSLKGFFEQDPSGRRVKRVTWASLGSSPKISFRLLGRRPVIAFLYLFLFHSSLSYSLSKKKKKKKKKKILMSYSQVDQCGSAANACHWRGSLQTVPTEPIQNGKQTNEKLAFLHITTHKRVESKFRQSKFRL